MTRKHKYNDGLVIKVYNNNNTYRDVKREIALSRQAFILGIPTAISFGIVSVVERFMGFPYQKAIKFFASFLKFYLNTK